MTRKLEDGEALYAALKTGGAPPLTRWALWSEIDPDTHARYAAAERAIRAPLIEALRPFANTPIPPTAKDHWPINYTPVAATFADVRRARAAVSDE